MMDFIYHRTKSSALSRGQTSSSRGWLGMARAALTLGEVFMVQGWLCWVAVIAFSLYFLHVSGSRLGMALGPPLRHTPLSSSHPCLLSHQLQSTGLSSGAGGPLWAACHTLGLGTTAWLLGCLCRSDTSPTACHCRQGYLGLLWTGHLCFTGEWRAPSGHWRHRKPSSAGFNHFYFNPRPRLPLQCLVNTTFLEKEKTDGILH